MAGTKKLTLTADPPSVVTGGTSTLKAKLTDDDNSIDGVVKFVMQTDGKDVPIGNGKPIQTANGIATTEFKDIKIMIKDSDRVTVKAFDTADAAVTPATCDIIVYDTTLDRKLAELSQKKEEQQKKDLEAAKSEKEVQGLQQEIESLKKAAAPPPEIKDTVTSFQGKENELKAGLTTAESTLKQLETDISAQIDKALHDELVGIQTRFTVEGKELNTRKDLLDKDRKTLETQAEDAKGLLSDTNKTWAKLLTTLTDVNNAVSGLTADVVKVKAAFEKGSKENDKSQVASAYAQLLAAKDKLAEAKNMSIDSPTLNKKLTDTWQKINAQKQAGKDISDKKTANENEAKAVAASLANLDTKRKAAIDNLIDAIVPKPA